jgi:hypothetical protein
MNATGLIAANSEWSAAGLGLLGIAALVVSFMTASKLIRRNRRT